MIANYTSPGLLLLFYIKIETLPTKTKKGLKVEARLDERDYEKGKRISDEDMAELKIIFHELYPNWNYSIEPRVTLPESRIFG